MNSLKNLKFAFNKIYFPGTIKQDRLKFLDGLRGMAVLFVLLSHSSNQLIFFNQYLNFQNIGKIGVYLFFVLSAYLLDRQIAMALQSRNGTPLFWLNYFLRRFLRIYPLYIIALLLFAFSKKAGLDTEIDFSDIIASLLLIKTKIIFWSIAVEFKYYFISPFLLIICHRLFKWQPILIGLLLSAITLAAIIFRNEFPLNGTATWPYLPIFLTGTAIAIYELLLKDKSRLKKYSWLIELGGITAFLIVLFTIPYFFKSITGIIIYPLDTIYFLPFALLWGSVLVALKYGAGLLKQFFELKFFRLLGVTSFSLYLFHYPILLLIDSHFLNIPQELKIYLFFISSIAVSMITYVLIERPLSGIKLYQHKIEGENLKTTL